MTPLYHELNRWRALTYRWGWEDCITLPADWVARITGQDPAADVRGTYESAGDAQRVWRFFTDPLATISPRMRGAGLQETRQPAEGDVGVILIADGAGRPMPHGAVCLGSTWAVKSPDGFVTALQPMKLFAAWGVGYAHP